MNLHKEFRSFYCNNYPQDMEQAIELFGIFGLLDVRLDTTKTTSELIVEHIFLHYDKHSKYLNAITGLNPNAKKILRAISINDRKILSCFKKAHLGNIYGGIAVEVLTRSNIIAVEYSREEDKRKTKPKLKKAEARYRISDKLYILDPFVRFWFYCVYPFEQEIAKKDFTNALEYFQEHQSHFGSFLFERLSKIMMKLHLKKQEIVALDSYWDAKTEIDILVETRSGIVLGECKWSKHTISKNELNKLHEKAKELKIAPTEFVLFARRGFSKELYKLQGQQLTLFSAKEFELLIKRVPFDAK